MKTFSAKPAEVRRSWYVIDAAGQPVGRVAMRAAVLLRGKHKAEYTSHIDTGDHVVVINAARAVFTGKKDVTKTYMRYSGFIGGHHSDTVREVREKKPAFLIEHAVKGMIPHNRLGRRVFQKLHVYPGPEHPHAAQQPLAAPNS
ncbi:50S ribosomal protein L13 [Methylacidimicrobium sp. B4]|uniref:50S ribosomal protein L13 n=1 Tax=Methylacidimicrobium sp. B4 TaxID=2796139 RepID=UPI001A8DBAE9|nr:50S ribosomal protein L13 [Methylacidimicrobium sp. B4]QSR84015.1 50S ribosomal protein L13 [Methylacidimicrobium sp. B4]